MRPLVKMVETWVRKGSQVVLSQPGWFSKVLTFTSGAVVVGSGAFLALLVLGWICQDTDRFVMACVVCCVLGFAWDLPSGLITLGGGVLIAALFPVVCVLLPMVAVVWILCIVVQQWQTQKGPTV